MSYFENKRKITVVFLSILAILLLILLFLILTKKNEDNKKLNDNSYSKNSLLNQTSFSQREDLIKESLADKFDVNPDQISVFIGRESEKHVNGAFFIENFPETESFSAHFFASTNGKIDIVWADKGEVDCSLIVSRNFPPEMAPNCF